jgi:2-methylisocitrate lyase-like PEP mutase family enzyme
MPNPWDLGTARLLEERGFAALATTSWGLAASRGRADYQITREELVTHVAELASGINLPLNIDSENCFPDERGGVATCVRLLADAGAAGCSIEDYNPRTQQLLSLEAATEAVGSAAKAAKESGIVLTARAENHLRGVEDLDDTIGRLRAYVQAGADVAYAPGIVDETAISRLVNEVPAPINYLFRPSGPSIPRLAALGVRRVSTGAMLTRAALSAVDKAVDEMLAGAPPVLDAT